MEIHYKIPERVQRATFDMIFRSAVQIGYISSNVTVKKSGGKSEIVNRAILCLKSPVVTFVKVFTLLKIDNSSTESVNISNPKLILDYNCFSEHKVESIYFVEKLLYIDHIQYLFISCCTTVAISMENSNISTVSR